MYLINGITDYPLQSQNLTLPDSSIVNLQIYFVPMQYGWFITNLTYGSFILNGFRITNSPNMLLQYQNQIPFGLACYSTANREPTQQEDFASGASQLYILDQTECQEYSAFLQTGAFTV
jgi:hypothetical protein